MSCRDTEKDWFDPLVTGRNRILTHAPLNAYPDAEAARRRVVSPFAQSLNGTWKFALSDSPEHMPPGFADAEFDDSDWLDMAVPSNWQLDERVDDQPIYTNMPYPFQGTPPDVPKTNPTGWYRTAFEVPADWAGRDVFLDFESCDSACKVWINGQEVGYSQDSKLPHEFEITSFLIPGVNRLSVMVVRYCDGFWLECQDYWHLSGIQRDVRLYCKPKARIRDYVAQTKFDSQYRNANLLVKAYMNKVDDLAAGYAVELQLYDPQEEPVFAEPLAAPVRLETPMYQGGDGEFSSAGFNVLVEAPPKWTAETPYLYTLVMTLKDPAGEAVDFESCRVGFRQVEIKDGMLHLNGKRMLVRGVNDHEHHPVKGRSLEVADMREEIIAMKRLNFNAVRTSHYPHHSVFYDLCDELGMYVVDEANLETHGMQAMISKDPLWMNAFMERAQRMALRDRNHACIVCWSLGNESGHGPHHAAMAAWLRHFDPTRPVQYESGFPGLEISDIMVPMYPRLEWVGEILSDRNETRPLIMCEYAYSKGNALGNFHKYWQLIDRLPRFQGGFIWDWRDKALVKMVDGRPQWVYGNEFDDGIGPDGYPYGLKENPQMCLNGVVNPDLTPKPGAWEVKKVQAPVAFDLIPDKNLIRVRNLYLALDLSHLEIAWEVTADGESVQRGVVAPPQVEPGERGDLPLPFDRNSSMPPGREVRLNLVARQNCATPWSEAGHVVAWEQFDLPSKPEFAAPIIATAMKRPGAVRLARNAERVRIVGDKANLVFDSRQGVFTSWQIGDCQVLSRPLEPSFMRARTDNDYIIGNPGSYCEEWLKFGLDRLQSRPVEWAAAEFPEAGAVVVNCQTRHVAPGQDCGIACSTAYTIGGDGRMSVEVVVDASSLPIQTLPRIGMKLGLAGAFENLAWYGRGPHESYPDRKQSAMVGIYRATVDEQFFPFVDPCECGGHQDTRWLSLTSEGGAEFYAGGRPLLHFSALRYTIEDLLQAGHVYELTQTEDVQLNLDGFHLGLGGDTGWTANVHSEYLLPPGIYRYGLDLAARFVKAQ